MEQEKTSVFQSGRLLIGGLVIVIIVLGFALVIMAIGQTGQTPDVAGEPLDALAQSENECVVCHRRTTPGIVEQYGVSTMAAAEVACQDCHEVATDYPGVQEHEGYQILASPTSAKCEKCHTQEVAQYNQSRHALPAYVAFAGSQELSATHLAMYEAIPEGSFSPDKSRNAIAALEGPDVTRFTCEGCHNVGKPAADGSIGQCQKCHLRHKFSLEQARKPETCNACHIGPDHPQYEIYVESPHGISYQTDGDNWNWDAEAGTLTTADFPAPTCAICHMSGFGTAGTTHDVGDRLAWFLFAPISTRRPSWQDNIIRMQGVCQECHNENYIDDFYNAADKSTDQVNEWVTESDQVMAPLNDNGLLTSAPFDETIDFVYFNLWHHWGRTTKFGTWMQGPDYAQWHGAYEVLHDLVALKELAGKRLDAAGIEP
jgi:hydroxylamine dehydrogenase